MIHLSDDKLHSIVDYKVEDVELESDLYGLLVSMAEETLKNRKKIRELERKISNLRIEIMEVDANKEQSRMIQDYLKEQSNG